MSTRITMNQYNFQYKILIYTIQYSLLSFTKHIKVAEVIVTFAMKSNARYITSIIRVYQLYMRTHPTAPRASGIIPFINWPSPRASK